MGQNVRDVFRTEAKTIGYRIYFIPTVTAAILPPLCCRNQGAARYIAGVRNEPTRYRGASGDGENFPTLSRQKRVYLNQSPPRLPAQGRPPGSGRNRPAIPQYISVCGRSEQPSAYHARDRVGIYPFVFAVRYEIGRAR